MKLFGRCFFIVNLHFMLGSCVSDKLDCADGENQKA